MSRSGERTLQAQGRKGGDWTQKQGQGHEGSATKVSCVLFSFLMFDELASQSGAICVPSSHIFHFSNPSSAKQTKVPAAFREDPVLSAGGPSVNPWVGAAHTLCLQSVGSSQLSQVNVYLA